MFKRLKVPFKAKLKTHETLLNSEEFYERADGCLAQDDMVRLIPLDFACLGCECVVTHQYECQEDEDSLRELINHRAGYIVEGRDKFGKTRTLRWISEEMFDREE